MSPAAEVVVILSGGLDSATCLAMALSRHPAERMAALSFDYGQRHRRELDSAAALARHYGVYHSIVRIDAPLWGASALTGDIPVPQAGVEGGVPATYVPARNMVFLAMSLGIAEALRAKEIHIGVNAVDYSGYPDCRPEFIEAMRAAADAGTKRGVEGEGVEIKAPLSGMSKAEIIEAAMDLGAPLELTWSCYVGADAPCGLCDSCRIRSAGFAEAGRDDPALLAWEHQAKGSPGG